MTTTAIISYSGLWGHLIAATTPAAGMKELRAEVLDRTGVAIRTLGVTKIVHGRDGGPTVIATNVFANQSDAIAFKLRLEGGPFAVDLHASV
jgi:hypothetical protein